MKRVIIILFALLPIFAAAQNEGSSDGLINKGSGILYFEGRPSFDPTPFTDASEFAIDLNTKKVYVYSGSGSVWNRYNAIDTLSTLADTANIDNRIGQLVYVNGVDQFWTVNSAGSWEVLSGGGGTDDQTAAEVATTPSGNFTSTNAQAGFEEHQSDIDQINTTLAAGSVGQILNLNIQADTVEIGPEYPYTLVYSQDFETDISTITAFNGGTVIDSSANGGFLEVIGDNNAKGAEVQYTHTADLNYTLRLNVKDVGNSGVLVFNQWATTIATITTPGVHYINFTSPSSAGAFGKEIIITPNTSSGISDTIQIEDIYLYVTNENSNIYGKEEVDALLSSKQDSINQKISEPRFFELDPIIYYNDFSTSDDATRRVLGLNSTRVYDAVNSQLDVTPAGAGVFGVYLFENGVDGSRYYRVSLDIDISINDTFNISAQQGSPVVSITESGVYDFMLFSNSPSGNFTDAIFITGNTGSFSINEISILTFPELMPTLYLDPDSKVEIGNNATAGDVWGVAIGKDATTKPSLIHGGTSGPERTAVGETAKALAWRATAIGGNSYAGATSSTAIGAGANCLSTHGTAIGRGAFVPNPSTVGFAVNNIIGGDLAHNLYIANTWGHQFDTPPGGISISSYATPSNNETSIHGHDAYDARSTPSSFNVDAGDFGIYAGMATGSGESGSINFYVGEGDNGQNTKDTPVKAGEFRSEEAVTDGTHFYLLNVATGTMQRVKIGAAGTGPGGSGKALYID